MSGDKIITGLQEALAHARGWRPIETAPQDGFVILAWMDAGGRTDLESRVEMIFWDTEDEDYAPYWCVQHEGHDDRTPTHWMPLPDAPFATTIAAQGVSRWTI